MPARREDDAVREFRLEGFSLVLVLLLVGAVVGGSFWAGRWYERNNNPLIAAATADPVLAGLDAEAIQRPDAIKPPADVDSEGDFFDGDSLKAEPKRQIERPAPAPSRREQEAPAPAENSGSGPAAARNSRSSTPVETAREDGRYFVQVFAGRDQRSAAQMVDKLQSTGYPVKLISEREGSGTLYKVRVGGYATRGDARSTADRLQGSGYNGAWVTEIGPS